MRIQRLEVFLSNFSCSYGFNYTANIPQIIDIKKLLYVYFLP